jgi:fructokinase
MKTMEYAPLMIGLGEVLWDLFPHAAHFGGAPANFAVHAQSLGARGAVASAVGHDELGDQALDILRDKGLDTRGMQRNRFPTGRVDIKVDAEGKPSYTFASDVAWDHLEWTTAWEQLAAEADAVCFGTLAQRSTASRLTVSRFLKNVPSRALRVFDVNLRGDFYNDSVVLQSIEACDVLKLNEDELPIVARACGVQAEGEAAVQQLISRFDLQLVALTLGAAGAVLVTPRSRVHAAAEPVTIRDTVGAGDSFTATMILGWLRGLPLASIGECATRVAAYVCTQAGATPPLPGDLQRLFAQP